LAYYRGTLDVAWQQVAALFPEGAATHPGDCNFLAGADLQLVAADLCLDAGDLAGAIAWLAAHDRWLAWAGAVRGQAEGQLGWACYHRVAGQEAPARHHAEQALARAEQPRQPLALLAAQRLLGQLAVDAGRCEEANEHLTAALALAERCQAPFEQALTLLVLAERAVQLGECDDARRLLGQVRTICEPLGATPTLRRADEIAARLPQRRASSDTYPAGLTAREVEVLRLVVAGLTDAEVGAQLFISPRTVSTHLTSIYSKLGVSSRVDATRVVVEVHHGAPIPSTALLTLGRIYEVVGEQYRVRPPVFPAVNAICVLERDIVALISTAAGDVGVPRFRVQA
jgi:ATP/maltotriose-dependent transcriptional regulator MalT